MQSRPPKTALVLGLCLALAGCGKNAQKAATPHDPAQGPAGAIGFAHVETDGEGKSRAEALAQALQRAVQQVEGVDVDAAARDFDAGAFKEETAPGKADILAQRLSLDSHGRISHFAILSESGPWLFGGPFRVRIGADIARYTGPASGGRPRLVVARVRDLPGSGAGPLLHDLVEADLAADGRFAVLDRQLGEDASEELDLIASGQAPKDMRAKLGQTLTADYILAPLIQSFGYKKTVVHFAALDVDQTTLSQGGAQIAWRLVNTVTGELVASVAFVQPFPKGPNPRASEQAALNAIAREIRLGAASRLFPGSVSPPPMAGPSPSPAPAPASASGAVRKHARSHSGAQEDFTNPAPSTPKPEDKSW